MKKSLSPFHGYPATRQVIDSKGGLYFRVEPHYLSPAGARIADALGGVSMIGALVTGAALNSDNPEVQGWHWIAAIAGPLLLLTFLQKQWRLIFSKHIRIDLTNDHVTVHGFFISTQFDRTLPHKFTLILHDKAEEEKDRHLLEERQAQSRGRFIKKKKYYGDAYHLSYEYMGQRNDILTVFGKKEALAIAARLKAIDDVLNANSGRSEGISLTPEDEWDDNAGDIQS